jgi:hypothetical protein
MHGDGRIDQIAPKRPQPRQCAILIGAGQPAISDHICRQDRRKFPGLGHRPCFQRVISLFSLCYLLLEKLPKSLIPLSDCLFVLNRLPVFLENLPVSGKKQGLSDRSQAIGARRHPQEHGGDRGPQAVRLTA